MSASAPLTLREYDVLPYERLPEGAVAALERTVARQGVPALHFFRHHLKADRYVGVIRGGSTSLQILPKIFADDLEDLGFLVFLLGYTRRLRIRSTTTADLASLAGSFLEIWIRHFADELNFLLRRRFRREYREIESADRFIRGKLLVHRLVDGLEGVRVRYPCRYEIFSEDHLLNRALRFCNGLLRRQTRIGNTEAILRENDHLLEGVPFAPVLATELDRLQLTRLNRHYEPILNLCRVLLANATIDVRAGELRQLALLFDMSVLFEDFVGEFLRRHASDCRIGDVAVTRVEPQKFLGHLFGEFKMNVDLAITDARGRRLLVDTKYKNLVRDRAHLGLRQSDFYQMFAYAEAGSKKYATILLLYPRTEAVERSFRSGDVTLHVRTLDVRSIWNPSTRTVDRVRAVAEFNKALDVEIEGAKPAQRADPAAPNHTEPNNVG